MAKNSDTVDAPTVEERLAAALELIAKGQASNRDVQIAQLKQTAPRSNASHPRISFQNPRGEKDHPMAVLKCEINHPYRSHPNSHGLTREEVELWNLMVPGAYTIELNDGSLMPVLIVGAINRGTGEVTKMTMGGIIDEDSGQPSPLFTNETKQRFPAISKYLRQMLGDRDAFDDDEHAEKYGRDDSPAHDVMPMKVEIRKVKQYLKATTPEEKAAAIAAGALSVSVGE